MKTTTKDFFFLQGDGECAALARSVDWHSTSVGDPEHWPQSLRNTVAMLLSSEFPMFLWWGNDLIQFYNDAYRPSLGNNGKHPLAMGQSGIDCWPEIWDFIYPLIEQVMTGGKSVWYENLHLPIYRNGQMEDVYWTFSYSPVRGDEGSIQGVLVVCTETTEKMQSLKNLKDSKAELEFAIEAAELGTWDLNPVTGKFTSNDRLREWFGLLPDEEIVLSMATDVISERDRQNVIEAIEAALIPASGGRYEIGYTIIHPKTKAERHVIAKGVAWFDEAGKPYRLNGTLQDITKDKIAVQKVTEARQVASLAVKSGGIGIFNVNFIENNFDYTPEFAAIMTGNKDKKDLNRNSFISYIHPDDQHLRLEARRSGNELGEFYYTPRVIWDDGSVHRLAIMASRVSDDNGKWGAFSGTVRDITLQESQQLALEEAEIRYLKAQREGAEKETLSRYIVEQSPVATCLFAGREMLIEVANDIMLNYWGRDRSVMGMPLAKAVPELEGQPFLQILDDVFTTGITYQDKAAKVDLALGGVYGTYYFDFTYKALRTSDGTIYGVMDIAVDVTQQVITQRLIDEQQKNLLRSFEESPVGIATIDKENLTFRSANKFYGELVGRNTDDIVNRPLLEAIPELIGQGFDELLLQVVETGKPYVAKEVSVKLVRNRLLETIYVDLTYQPRWDSNENITGILVVATDVTQQVVTRLEVEASETKFRSLIMNAPIAMAVFRGTEFIIEIANDIILSYLFRDKAIIGKSYREAVPELERQGFFALIEKVYATGTAYEQLDAKVELMKDGVLVTSYFDYTYTPLFDSTMSVYAIMLTSMEVTEKVLSRKKLEEAQTALNNAIELAELVTWKLDIKKDIFIYSERFMDWLGFTEDTKDLEGAYHPLPEEYRQSVPEAVALAIMPGGTGIYDNEHPIVNRVTGQTRIIHATARVYYDVEGNPEFLSGTAQDVTKERKLQQELEVLVQKRTLELRTANNELEINNLELKQFAYIASHDLQEPVRKIAIYMQMLEANLESINEKSRGYIEKINSSAKRMTSLVRDVLGFSQLSEGTSVDFQSVDLNELMAELTMEFELIIEEKGAVIQYDSLPVIDAIPLQLSQLFGNLISNSLKYVNQDRTPEILIKTLPIKQEELHFSGAIEDVEYCKFEISDNGIGFEQQYAEKIFAIFQRLHGKKEFVGTGIGLAMCKKIVQNHHGHIYATSVLGKGATFTILLPVSQSNQTVLR